jgi:hypothetical protein
MLGGIDWSVVALAGGLWAALVIAGWTVRWRTSRPRA